MSRWPHGRPATPDVTAIRYVTEHYVHLQGLRLVPVGVPFVASALWRLGWLTWWPAIEGRGASWWFWGLLTGAVGVSFGVRRWYESRFGRVVPATTDSGVASLAVFAMGLFITVGCQLVFDLPVSLPLLFVAAVLATIGCQGRYGRPHYVIIASASAAVAMLRPFGVSVHACGIALDALIGAGLIGAGVADHRLLQRVYQDAHGDLDVESV